MRIIAFDFDGMLSNSEMAALLGKKNGTTDEMADVTERAMSDEMSYVGGLRSRAHFLKGLEEEPTKEAYGEVELHPDATGLIQRLRNYGHHVVIFTGGLERDVERALEKEGIEVDDTVSDRLPVKGGRLIGDVEESLTEGTKDTTLETHAAELDVPMDRTITVGDGANNLPMLEVAGLSVGLVPESAVHPACDAAVASVDRLKKLSESHRILDADEWIACAPLTFITFRPIAPRITISDVSASGLWVTGFTFMVLAVVTLFEGAILLDARTLGVDESLPVAVAVVGTMLALRQFDNGRARP